MNFDEKTPSATRFHGSPCSICGGTERGTANGGCVPCALRRTRIWKVEHREEMRAKSLEWYFANQERSQTTTRRWVEQNAQRVADTNRDWRKANPLRTRRIRHRRRALLKGQPSYTPEQAKMILVLQGGWCVYCNRTEALEIDHVVPLSRGGSNLATNIQWLCRFHNASKRDLTDSEYRRKMGFPLLERHLPLAIFGAVFLV